MNSEQFFKKRRGTRILKVNNQNQQCILWKKDLCNCVHIIRICLYFSNREGCAFYCGVYINLSSEIISVGKRGGTTTLSFYTERSLSLKIDVAFTYSTGYEHFTVCFISAFFVVYEEFLMFLIYITAEVLVTFRSIYSDKHNGFSFKISLY